MGEFGSRGPDRLSRVGCQIPLHIQFTNISVNVHICLKCLKCIQILRWSKLEAFIPSFLCLGAQIKNASLLYVFFLLGLSTPPPSSSSLSLPHFLLLDWAWENPKPVGHDFLDESIPL